MSKRLIWGVALLALLPLRMQDAGAGVAPDPGPRTLLAEADRRTPRRITMSEAFEIVQRQTGGRVLQAQDARGEGRNAYRIKVLTRQGEVRVVYVNAETGAIE